MIELNLKDNATVDVIAKDFPIGIEDKIKVNIEDSEINNIIKLNNTGTCKEEHNLYSYGEFNTISGIVGVYEDLNEGSIVDIASGVGQNYSNCLHCKASELGLGTFYMKPDKGVLVPNTTYIISCYIKVVSGSVTIGDPSISDTLSTITSNALTSSWSFISKTFTTGEDVENGFNFYIKMFSEGECYIDNLMLFDSQYEIKDLLYDLDVSINILNPCSYIKHIDKIINWNYNVENDTNSVLLYMPAITTVDIKDNILCNIVIYRKLKKKVVELGNTIYNSVVDLIYESKPFVLHGYLLPIDEQNIDVDLIVGRI